MLERWSGIFRLFLQALQGSTCPFCAIAAKVEQGGLQKLRRQRSAREAVALCGQHLRGALQLLEERGSRARVDLVRAVIAANINENNPAGCEVCDLIEAKLNELVTAVRRFDPRIRFEKALERAPLFCRTHDARVRAGKPLPSFSRVQGEKLKDLSDDLVQALFRHNEGLEELIGRALTYAEGWHAPRVAAEVGRDLGSSAGQTSETANQDAEFEEWDRRRLIDRLGELESEAAKLRYLVNENRRLKLAHAAVEATRRDLEREREALRQVPSNGSAKSKGGNQ